MVKQGLPVHQSNSYIYTTHKNKHGDKTLPKVVPDLVDKWLTNWSRPTLPLSLGDTVVGK